MTTRWFPDEMPVPAVSAETVGWWEAAARHRLVVQRCTACGTTRHPPGPVCPRCRSTDADWATLPGTGRVFTYTVVRQAFIPSLASQLPYIVMAVDLDGAEGARIVSNLVDIDPAEVTIEMRVEVVWEDMGPDLALPRFRPAQKDVREGNGEMSAGSSVGAGSAAR
ncbi:MAG TPA: Zn-ribbon domain-containing OB-fold protein [Acidimicrobiales bacterium]|nr:Zn-ribbon domain-containing OB-fold protein [Acidimicrobiales bacterium]